MPRIEQNTTLRPDLGQAAYEYDLEGSQRGFIGDSIFPIFETDVQSSEFPVIKAETFLSLQDTKRAPRSGYGRSDWDFGSDTFSCKENGWEESIDDSEARMYARYFDAEIIAVQRATDILKRGREKQIADQLFNETNFTAHAVGTAWTAANATIKKNIDDATDAFKDALGINANALILSEKGFKAAMNHAEIKDYTKYTNPVLLSAIEVQRRLLAQYLGVDEVLVGDAAYNTAKKGKALSMSRMWADTYGMVARIATNPADLKEPCLGRTFLWTGDSPQMLTAEQYREEQTRSNVYRVRNNTDVKFMMMGAGYLLKGII